MQDRRESVRDKVMYGGVAEIGERGATRECIVRNISDNGAAIEFSNDFLLPKEQLSLRIARKGRSFMARVIWWRDNFVGVAFRAESPAEPVSDLGERLRKSGIRSASCSERSTNCLTSAEAAQRAQRKGRLSSRPFCIRLAVSPVEPRSGLDQRAS